jgi:hypothetical protein
VEEEGILAADDADGAQMIFGMGECAISFFHLRISVTSVAKKNSCEGAELGWRLRRTDNRPW